MANYRTLPVPPLRPEDPIAPDPAGDKARVEWARELWTCQDELVAPRNRMVEENIRMLAGDQWSVWVRQTDEFLSINDLLTDAERLWRQKPVVNLLLPWFMLTHSRMTENPPIIGFLPSSADEVDALLAEVWDMIQKTMWRALGMEQVHSDCMAWLIPGGRSYFKTRVDPEDDDPGLTMEVLAAPEVRGEWGPRPWHKKRWHYQLSYLTAEEVWDTFGENIDPTTSRKELGTDLHSLLYSSGYYQAASRRSMTGTTEKPEDKELVEVGELWMAPTSKVPGMERVVDPETGEVASPGGRLLIHAGEKLLRDGPRPADFMYTSPIRRHDFVGLPGRPSGTSPQEALNPIQRQYNRVLGQWMEHANLTSRPKPIIHQSVQMDDWDNSDQPLVANWAMGVNTPVSYLQPPPMDDVVEILQLLERQIETIGSLRGSEGRRPESGISGESVKELRANSDRPINATLSRAAIEYGRWSEDLVAYLRVLWPAERLIEYAGEDNMVETITVTPDLWRGKVDVFADPESMIPQGREGREERADSLLDRGFFGPPDSQKARSRYLDYARMPQTGRDIEPGHQHRRMARRAMGLVLRGGAAEDIQLYRWYDFAIWLDEMEEHLSSPEFLRHEPPIKVQLTILHELTTQAFKLQRQMQVAEEVTAQSEAMMVAESAAAPAQSPPPQGAR